MRVALTEHIDRSEEKLLLRGTVGTVHSWVWPVNDPRPSVVYIKFNAANWQLEGIDEPGVYPVVPQCKAWYLDKSRKFSLLKVSRTQLPLAPAYAMTAHSSQGKTLTAVLLDLHVDKRVDPTIGTVAATRVRSQEDVLILRPFPLWLYQRTPSDGPQLLLRQLRGESIDWTAYREARKPSAECLGCKQFLQLDAFNHEQWEQIRTNRPAFCLACKNGQEPKRKRKLYPDSLQKVSCVSCKQNKIADAFPRAQLVQAEADTQRQCLKCLQTQRTEMRCCRCSHTKPSPAFAPQMVTMPSGGILCLDCQEVLRPQAGKPTEIDYCTCRGCSKIFPAAGIVFAVDKERKQRCMNCATRSGRKVGEQTCRNQNCKRKWTEKEQPEEGKRPPRYCPACRK